MYVRGLYVQRSTAVRAYYQCSFTSMNNIPLKLRQQLEADPYYHQCARQILLGDHVCQGDPIRGRYGRMIEWEHALVHAGKQVQAPFAIVPLCWWAHRGPGATKEVNVWIALNRASGDEIEALSRAVDYTRMRRNLNARYGVPMARLVEDDFGQLAIVY